MKTMINPFKAKVRMIVKMDNELLIKQDDTVYDEWLTLLGNYYDDDNFPTETAFIKNALLTDKTLWDKLNDFYNLHIKEETVQL